jgi:arsenate reductase
MAEAFLNNAYGDRYEAKSAGITPTCINPIVVKVMAEEGIDLSNARSKDMEEFMGDNFDLVITLCEDAKENCPVFPGDELDHHGFRNPSSAMGSEEEILVFVREIRNEIKEWILTRFQSHEIKTTS